MRCEKFCLRFPKTTEGKANKQSPVVAISVEYTADSMAVFFIANVYVHAVILNGGYSDKYFQRYIWEFDKLIMSLENCCVCLFYVPWYFEENVRTFLVHISMKVFETELNLKMQSVQNFVKLPDKSIKNVAEFK